MATEVTAIFDIGKTNKKFFLFDSEFNEIVHEYIRFEESTDEDGFPCEDLPRLEKWIRACLDKTTANPEYDLKNLNFSTYGASLVHLDKDGKPATAFYNYMKDFPEDLARDFFSKYGNEKDFSLATCSPYMGFLNSGFQLYFLKYRRPEVFKKISCSVHFPQYLSYLFTGRCVTDYTSLGCHTGLWDFTENTYHKWVKDEGLEHLLSDVVPATTTFHSTINGKEVNVGVGVHDSSSALIPYINAVKDPFILISTGTWSICMNFFNEEMLTGEALEKDCLNFYSVKGTTVKASRLFLGKSISNQVRKLSEYFNHDYQEYKSIRFNPSIYKKDKRDNTLLFNYEFLKPEQFGFIPNTEEDLSRFDSFEQAYHALIDELTDLQIASFKLAMGKSKIQNIFIDGGFSSNEVFVQYLANKLTDYRIYSTSFACGTALGAALLVNYHALPENFLEKNYKIREHKSLIAI